jgi:hypothetical protein
MEYPETKNCYGGKVSVRDGVVSPEIDIRVECPNGKLMLALDQAQAALLIPVLQHFVETGEMP